MFGTLAKIWGLTNIFRYARIYTPENKDNYEININTVKAIKLSVEEVKALREAATVGVNSKATAEKALKSKRRGYWSDRKRAEAEKTIDIFKRITA